MCYVQLHKFSDRNIQIPGCDPGERSRNFANFHLLSLNIIVLSKSCFLYVKMWRVYSRNFSLTIWTEHGNVNSSKPKCLLFTRYPNLKLIIWWPIRLPLLIKSHNIVFATGSMEDLKAGGSFTQNSLYTNWYFTVFGTRLVRCYSHVSSRLFFKEWACWSLLKSDWRKKYAILQHLWTFILFQVERTYTVPANPTSSSQ